MSDEAVGKLPFKIREKWIEIHPESLKDFAKAITDAHRRLE